MSINFADHMLDLRDKKKSNLILGLKPDFAHIPDWLCAGKLAEFGKNWAAVSEAVISFDNCVIEAVAPFVAGIMPRLSYYQQYGAYGLRALERTIINALNHELVVIIDAGLATYDPSLRLPGETFIGHVSGWEGERPSNLHAHATTLIPYYGEEMVKRYVQLCSQTSRGIYIIAGPQFNSNRWSALGESIVGTHAVSSLGVLFDEHSIQYLSSLDNNNLSAIIRLRDDVRLEQVWLQLSDQVKNKTLICIEEGIYDYYSHEALSSVSEDEEAVRSRFIGCAEAAEKYRKKFIIN